MEPPDRRKTLGVPNPRRYASAAACSAGSLQLMIAAADPCCTVKDQRTVGGTTRPK